MTVTASPTSGFRRVPAERAARYRRAGLWAGTTVVDEVLAAVAAAPPERPALVTDHQVILQYIHSLGPHGAHRF